MHSSEKTNAKTLKHVARRFLGWPPDRHVDGIPALAPSSLGRLECFLLPIMGQCASLGLVKFNSPEPRSTGDAIILKDAPDMQIARAIVVNDGIVRMAKLAGRKIGIGTIVIGGKTLLRVSTMPLSREKLLARAAQAEETAKTVSDPLCRTAYLELATALRHRAAQVTTPAGVTDREIEGLVERMVGSSKSSL